ncbi:aspartate-semialdehyde dehydrogenase [Streptomyces endophyticus]|uniref:Aspartate-semialdehyde dehydrogenase n=1 Tax=Streptomyces endophyticus TaxID=714166 RepID=A0ABU6FBM0_9ACTN|nr:aspartate-semialdehyde dehydrogenase [Streptomyces endophyticus]MEB8340246.1 aspartate-semialdehyde dehydrogenase [Streptomyces endophyticus]
MPYTPHDTTAPRIALVGATGAVGETLIGLIEDRAFRYREIQLVASPRSQGRTLRVDGREHRVSAVDTFDFSTVDLAFFSAGSDVSRKWAPVAAAQGALVIDNTNAFRMDPDTPLVVPQVNADALATRPASGIVANPNCSTIPLVRLLRPIEDRWGLSKVVVSTYQAASGRGHSGTAELHEATRAALANPADPGPQAEFAPTLAFNVIPFIDELLDSGFTMEEQKMLQESRKILALRHLDVTTTCVRVPVRNGHSEAVWIECHDVVDRAELVAALCALPEVTVHDRDAPGAFPTPRTIAEANDVHVGRIRVSPHNPRGCWLWVVADNLRIGAALNALQIAEELVARGTL